MPGNPSTATSGQSAGSLWMRSHFGLHAGAEEELRGGGGVVGALVAVLLSGAVELADRHQQHALALPLLLQVAEEGEQGVVEFLDEIVVFGTLVAVRVELQPLVAAGPIDARAAVKSRTGPVSSSAEIALPVIGMSWIAPSIFINWRISVRLVFHVIFFGK